MAYEVQMKANTNLSVDDINAILSKNVGIQRIEDYPDTILGDGFYGYVYHFEPGVEYSDYLEKPVTLDITFRLRSDANGNVELKTIVLNWLRYTDADTVLEENYEMITLLRVDGKLIKNINPRVLYLCGNLNLGDIPHEEANLGLFLPYDQFYVDSVHEVPHILARFCRHIFDDQETKIVTGLTSEERPQIRACAERDGFEIRAIRYDPFRWSEKWKRDGATYPFLPNCNVDLHYTKGRGILRKKNTEYIIPARDMTLKGVAGLIKRTDCSLVLEFGDPKRDVLMYHAGELTLFEDTCWSQRTNGSVRRHSLQN